MKKLVDYDYIEMTPEEIAEFERMEEEILTQPIVPTDKQRLSALENAFAEFVLSLTGGDIQ